MTTDNLLSEFFKIYFYTHFQPKTVLLTFGTLLSEFNLQAYSLRSTSWVWNAIDFEYKIYTGDPWVYYPSVRAYCDFIPNNREFILLKTDTVFDIYKFTDLFLLGEAVPATPAQIKAFEAQPIINV